MLKITIGFIIGLFVSMIGFALLAVFDIQINLTVITNMIIAAATVVATFIHLDSQSKARKDRVWDMNKAVLLDLAHALSDAIEATENELHNLWGGDGQVETKRYAFSNIKDKIDYAINVYKPLMDKDLINSISKHNKTNKETTLEVSQHGLDREDAYEIMLKEHKELYGKVLMFISKISGVKYT
ncbi:MAG: hypothetical protein ABJH28_13545 [Paraglaciecola sp.]|uniref:hypothetical protein n=1 Tax=Paraglaciecola sp. TaxID=1920173 RepID=UPI0032633195